MYIYDSIIRREYNKACFDLVSDVKERTTAELKQWLLRMEEVNI